MSGGIVMTQASPVTRSESVLGLKGSNVDFLNADGVLGLTSGTTRFGYLPLRAGDLVSDLYVGVGVVSATVTTIKLGLYTTAGGRLAASANITTLFDATGITPAAPMTTAYAVPTTGWYLVAALSVATTAGSLYMAPGTGGVTGMVRGGTEASQTDLDATATIATSSTTFWCGWS